MATSKLSVVGAAPDEDDVEAQAVSTITVSIEQIGPEQARDMLSYNTHNRPIRQARVATYSRIMAVGEWALNGETIKFADTGLLLDGEHRLMSVVESGQPIWTVVVRGLPESAQETIDVGDRRTLADVLQLRGETNVYVLAAAINAAWRIESTGTLERDFGHYPVPSMRELLDYYEANRALQHSTYYGSLLAHQFRYPPSVSVSLHYLQSKIDADAADAFWRNLASGDALGKTDPVRALRDFLVRDMMQRMRRSDVILRAAVTIKAWNARRANRPVTVLTWRHSGKSPEPFPTLE